MNKITFIYWSIFILLLLSMIEISFVSAWSDDSTLTQNVDGCNELNTTDAVYTLTQNVSSTDTCFNITANNITLDCNNYEINSTLYGVYSEYNLTTVKNCKFIGDFTNAIYFYNVNNGTINNSTISFLGSYKQGIILDSSSNNTISNNNIIITSDYIYGSGTLNSGILMTQNSNFNTISNNIITITSEDAQLDNGIKSYFNSNFNIISDNIITINGRSHDYGIFIQSDSNIISNNIIIGFSDINGYGIYLSSSLNNTILNNTIALTGVWTSGIEFGIYLTSSSNNTILNNTITTDGGNGYGGYTTMGYGIYLISSSSSNTFSNNIITNINQDTESGIAVTDNSNSNIFSSNILTESGNQRYYDYGIWLYLSSDNNSFSNMNIKIDRTNSYAIFLADTNHNFTIKDSILNSSLASEFYIDSVVEGGTWNFTNVTRADGGHITINRTTGANGTLNMMWYLDVNINYTNGTAINQANVTAYNILGKEQQSILTDSNGKSRLELIEYIDNGTIIYYSPYTLITFLESYNLDSQTIDLSQNRQLNAILILTPPRFSETGQVIYSIMNSAGAGLGMFMTYISSSIFGLLVLIALISVFAIIGYAVARTIIEQLKNSRK